MNIESRFKSGNFKNVILVTIQIMVKIRKS